MMVWKKRQLQHVLHTKAVAGVGDGKEAYNNFIDTLLQRETNKKEDFLRSKLDNMQSITAIRFAPLEPLAPQRNLKRVQR